MRELNIFTKNNIKQSVPYRFKTNSDESREKVPYSV